MPTPFRCWLAVISLVITCSPTTSISSPATPQQILATKCFACHGPDAEAVEGGLRLDTRTHALSGGASERPAIVPGDPAASEIIRRITATDPDDQMPPPDSPRQLTEEEKDALARWIADDAPYEKHWAFLPVQSVPDDTTIDSLIGSNLSPPAPVSVLVRRLFFGLTGLPPSPEDLARWTAREDLPDLVDSLLASTHYGEHQARHWLDLARYADSAGYETDFDRPHAYHYRDFVIRAFNSDLPFATFVKWQLAGDEFAPHEPDALAATGFCTVGPAQNPPPTDTALNMLKVRYDALDDLVSTTGTAFLSLTLGCARCHDHKFDPIPTADYYQLTSAFLSSESVEAPLSVPHRDLELWIAEQKTAFRNEKIDALASATADEKLWLKVPLAPPAESKQAYKKFGSKVEFTTEDWTAWLSSEKRAHLADLRSAAHGPALPTGNIIRDSGSEPLKAFVYARGDVGTPTEEISLGFIEVLGGGRPPEYFRDRARAAARHSDPSTFGRAALAEWLIDPEHGAGALLARVAVNRIWKQHFGSGIVRSPDDFGVQGDQPTHPDLLEFLAAEFVRNGWQSKPIHRLILNSAAYQQVSSDAEVEAARAGDPTNRLLRYRRPLRLQAEAVRDSILAVSGGLDLTLFGAPIRTPIPASAMATRSKHKYPIVEDLPDQWRRSIYLFVKRSVPTPLMEMFDAPAPDASCGKRLATTVPTQALALLNDRFVRNQATVFADRVRAEAGADVSAQIDHAFLLALGRLPASSERARSLEFFKTVPAGTSADVLSDLCHALYNLNEFIYVE